jgi:cobalt-zinc-cadmium efflux system outer membrane protein
MLLALAMAALLMQSAAGNTEQSSTAAPAPGGRASLTLADVLARVRDRSPSIEAARARHRASVQARSVQPLLPNPSIELRGENFGPSGASSLNRDVFATVSQPIELGGKRRARLAEADAIVQMSDAEVAAAEWSIAFDLAQMYVDAVRAREALAALGAQRDSMAELVRIVEARVDEGVAAESELHKFQTEQTRLASEMTRTSVALRSMLVRLSALLGEEVTADQLAVPDVPASVLSARPGDDTVASRPDVQTALTRVRRAEAAAAVERSLGIPDVAVTAGYKRTDGFDTAVAGVTMAVPLFNRNRVAVAHATGELAAAGLELEQTRRQALADARARWDAAVELRAHADRVNRELLEPARIVRDAARAAFIEGRGDVLQLVDAERVYGEAVREALELQLDAALALIHARLSVGQAPLP